MRGHSAAWMFRIGKHVSRIECDCSMPFFTFVFFDVGGLEASATVVLICMFRSGVVEFHLVSCLLSVCGAALYVHIFHCLFFGLRSGLRSGMYVSHLFHGGSRAGIGIVHKKQKAGWLDVHSNVHVKLIINSH